MLARLRLIIRWPVYALLGAMLLFLSGDVLNLNVAQRAAAPYMYDLLEWEASNFLSKWLHRTTQIPFLSSSSSDEERAMQVRGFFELNDEARRLQGELTRLSAQANGTADPLVIEAQSALDEVMDNRNRIKNDVEETIEGSVSRVVDQLGLSTFGQFLFPPVDVRLSSPPKLLVTSPRDRISRTPASGFRSASDCGLPDFWNRSSSVGVALSS